MSEERDFNPGSMGLPPSSEFEETAALLAYSVSERRPPAHVKAQLMALIRPEPVFALSTLKWIPMAGAVAVLVFAFVPRLSQRRAEPELLSVRGQVTLDGRSVSAGERLVPGQTIAVSGDGEAVVRIGGRAGFRLSHGARALIARNDSAVEVRLLKGWILSAVKTGTPYSVVTDHAEAAALGTDFMVKEEHGWAQVCICHGRLRLRGFPENVIAADHHYAISQSAFPLAAAEGMKGHADDDIASLRAQLRLASSK